MQKNGHSLEEIYHPPQLQCTHPLTQTLCKLHWRQNHKGTLTHMDYRCHPPVEIWCRYKVNIALQFDIYQLFFGHQDVKYPEYLDLQPFMSQSQGEPQVYGLYAVLVHSGFSCHAGHYFCYIKVLELQNFRTV